MANKFHSDKKAKWGMLYLNFRRFFFGMSSDVHSMSAFFQLTLNFELK